MRPPRLRLLVVGAFAPEHNQVVGGILTSCRILASPKFTDDVEIVAVDTTQTRNPPPAFVKRLFLAVGRFLKYLWRFERRHPEVVLLFVASGASLAEKGVMAWYARIRNRPAVMFPRAGSLIDAASGSRINRAVQKLAFAGARKVFCQSERWRQFAVNLMGFRPEDTPVIPNWTATEQLLALGRSREYSPRLPVRLLFLGWIERHKGVAELIRACQRLGAAAHFELRLVGDGRYRREAAEMVKESDISNAVQFCGWLHGEDVAKELAAADVLVLPSWHEGLPNSMIEAMAAGLAVVVSDVGAIPDYIVDGANGILIPPRDIPALETALRRVIEDHDLRRKLGTAGHTLAAREFAVDTGLRRVTEELFAVARGAAT